MFRQSLCLLLASLSAGCAIGVSSHDQIALQEPHSSQVQRGVPNRFVDGTGWVVGIPNKIAYWNRRADNHDVSAQTEDHIIAYLQHTDLSSVLVRVNQYDPLGEWSRLRANHAVAPGWRYTVGSLHWLKYTLLPGRIYGGDAYNPYTDSLYIYSDVPALGLLEAAYSRDVHNRTYRGTYAGFQELPFLAMWHKTIAMRNSLDYVKQEWTEADRVAAYQILYSGYGADWGGQFASFVPYGHFFGRLVGAGIGHTINGIRALVRPVKNEQQPLAPQQSSPELEFDSGSLLE